MKRGEILHLAVCGEREQEIVKMGGIVYLAVLVVARVQDMGKLGGVLHLAKRGVQDYKI